MTEQVMVVAREELARFIDGHSFHLIHDGLDAIFAAIDEKHFFIDRPTAEVSPEYKQIIPYVLVRHEASYFLLQRTSKQTESRLHHKLSLGIGGHINPDTPTILGGLQKELDEEIAIHAPYSLKFVGILNDDTNEVSRVHLGAVYVADVDRPEVTIVETDKMTGAWIAAAELAAKRAAMETWSQVVFDQYIARK